MISHVLLYIRRIIILLIVCGLAYFTVFTLFPFIDARLPLLIAVIITYGLMAYVGIPAVLRVLRLIDRPNHVPTYCTTSDGWASDPINIAILARNQKDFIWGMKKAGWHVADKSSLKNMLHEAYALIFNKPYQTAPFSKLYLFGRKQDIGFQIPVGNSPRVRHHVRFWRVEATFTQNEHEHQNFWRRLFKRFLSPQQELWVGAAIYDAYPFAIRWRNGQFTHLVHPDADYERDFLIKSFQHAHVLKNVIDIKAGDPYSGRGQAIGMTIISDGFVKLCEIKRQIVPPPDSDKLG